MVSYAEVRRWRSDPLDSAEQRLKGVSEKLLGLSDEFADMATPTGWTGDAASAAVGTRTRVTDRMEHVVAGVAAARAALMHGADAIIGLRHGVEEADGLAQAHGFTIGADGSVGDTSPPQNVPTDQIDDVRAERTRIQAELADRVEQILRRAADIDNDLSAALGRVANGEIGDNGATSLAAAAAAGAGQGELSVLEPPKAGGSPAGNAAWWDMLSESERRQILRDRPEWVGNRDGIPAEARDEANRAILGTEKTRLQAEASRLRAELDDNTFGGWFTDADDRLEEIEGKLKGIEAIEGKLTSTEGAPEDERHYLLGFSTGDDGRAIVAKGNPDTADNVATFVPGTGADLGGVGDLLNRGDKMYLAAEDSNTDAKTSVITWVGYDAPDGLHNAISEDYAQGARHDLDNFQDGLRVTHNGPPSHNTVIGHSYGSTVIGHSGRDVDLDVDKMVFVGSPGVGVDNAGQLNIDRDNVYATTAQEDIIHETPRFIHGPQPIADDFGAHVFESDPGQGDNPLENVETHSAYWEDGNKSLTNMGHLIVGNTDKVR